MCGIVGYIGQRDARGILVEGLKMLEYRGYDSAGVALLADHHIEILKTPGKVSKLDAMVGGSRPASIGIGHTRWATHGEPNEVNAHPHKDCSGNIAIIHNGDHRELLRVKTKLTSLGHRFESQTDTEVLAHLIEEFYRFHKNLENAVRTALKEVDGTFGVVVMASDQPDILIAARRGSPLVIGLGDSENLIASDASALVKHTRKVVYLQDNEVAVLTRDSVSLKSLDDKLIEREAEQLTFDIEQIERGLCTFHVKGNS